MTQPDWRWNPYTQQWQLVPGPPQVQQPAGSTHVSGLTTGSHLIHGLLTVCTCGAWAPVWFLAYWLGRRRIR